MRKTWTLFSVVTRAAPAVAGAWWVVLFLLGVLPSAFAVAMGVLVAAVQRGDPLGPPLAFAGAVFIALLVLAPIHNALSGTSAT